MNNGTDYTPLQMFCPSCGMPNTGKTDGKGKILFECSRCKLVMVRTRKGRRHNVIDLYAGKEKNNDNNYINGSMKEEVEMKQAL